MKVADAIPGVEVGLLDGADHELRSSHRAHVFPLPTCPVCAVESPVLHRVGKHDYRACPSCSHQFLDFQPVTTHAIDYFGDGYFSGEGDGYPDYLAGRDLLIRRGQAYADKIARHTGKRSGDLLDIGGAAGFLAKGFQSRGWRARGIDPCRSMAAHASREEGIPTSHETIEIFHSEQRFDLVLLIQVIGHLEDPAAALEKVRTLLKPGGHLLIETWDNRSLAARLLGRRWHEYNPPSVLHAFSRRSLRLLAERSGFSTVASKRITKNLKAAHAKAILRHKFGGDLLHRFCLRPALSLIPDCLVIPYPGDDLFWTCLTPS